MTDTIRCPACRGGKKVPKLGGMIGECDACGGTGTILAVDKPTPFVAEPVEQVSEVINQVANVAPITITEEQHLKVDGKKALYRRKKA